MKTRTRVLIAAVTVTIASAATALLLATGQSASAQPGPAGATLRFVAQDEPGNEAFDDLGPQSPDGPDIGDVLAFTQTLTRDGKSVGQIHVVAVGVDHRRQLSHADATLVLSGGDIEVAGIVAQTPTFTLAVVAGTGVYVGESGTLVFDNTGSAQTLTLHLNH
jgi:hypothetical protein